MHAFSCLTFSAWRRFAGSATAAGLAGLIALAGPALAGSTSSAASPTPVSAAAAVESYALAADGGLIYNPLSREARQTGQLRKYAGTARRQSELQLHGARLKVSYPPTATAYDVLPIDYELSWPAAGAPPASFPWAVEAVAFEEPARQQGRPLYDLALPGPIALDVAYLGSITAHMKPEGRHRLKADLSDTPGEYPGFIRQPLRRSGVVQAGDLVWFKFRATNTGATILDAEGFGGSQWNPELLKREADGQYTSIGRPYNVYIRDLTYWYPGESREFWVQFASTTTPPTPQGLGLVAGDYKLRLSFFYRDYRSAENAFLNLWEGSAAFTWEMPFTVEARARQTPVAPGVVTLSDGGQPDRLTRYVHTFEEFMTAFDCHLAPPPPSTRVTTGTLYLQVAPWTTHLTLKLIQGRPTAIASVALPVQVESDTLSVTMNTSSPLYLTQQGRRVPMIYSQCMADMRTNVQLGPFPERHIPQRLREMQEHGINVVATTMMPWLYTDAIGGGSEAQQCDGIKYALDVCRQIGMRVEGWGAYPYDRQPIEAIHNWLTGEKLELDKHLSSVGPSVSYADPNLPRAQASAWRYQFQRWGDLYYQLQNGDVPIGVEDTWGWLRQDMNIRYTLGARVTAEFRAWLVRKYGNLAGINAAWGTRFATLESIEPEANQNKSFFGACWEYSNPDNPFHDWNAAVADWDQFRTGLRLRDYRQTLELLREKIPLAVLLLRTENGNMLVGGLDPQSPNPHERHIYYSQRRCALIAEQISAAGFVKFHSDYTVTPYTPTELRRLVRLSVAQGIRPIYFPQFDNMRDMALNTRYGTDYQRNYNLPAPMKAEMMHCLTAAYPWFKILHEEGGAPGILWEDYQCDGFATETQKKELKFFMGKLRQAQAAAEAAGHSATPGEAPDRTWRKGAGKAAYRLDAQETATPSAFH